MSNELLQKVLDTTNLGANAVNASGDSANLSGAGLLYPDQANRFLDYMWDATILAKSARTIRMRSNTTEIDRVSVGQRIMTVASEDNPRDYTNTTSGQTGEFTNAEATFSKVSLTTRKLRLDWELSSESLEDNVEGPDLEDHIARLMATQAGNDIEDLLINGIGSSTGLMSAFKGFRKLAIDNAHVVDANGQGLDKAVFNAAIKALPRKYKQRRNQLRFFTGSNLVQDYLYNLTASTTATPFDIGSTIIRGDVAANDGGPGTVTPFAFGIPVINVPLMDETRAGDYAGQTGLHGDVHLAFPQNFVIGIKRDVTVYRLFQPKKDTIEYTLFIRVGCVMENYDAHVIVKNVKVAGSTGGSLGSVTHGANTLGGSGTYTF
ncbi:Phage major capsid protein, HK97 [uncultured Caudovirales phage]|uniref:Phage major capsid protein, HK97 n=1 Tax=uncultured Caudovirales phage TaxID=2100421 RepID=A0A6J5RMN1_9CAUD|nr:Phage major capsid protein, HK97 [uncultured Caudovirales phage]CAB4193445.1 Phage major capsid protein, HK97 [uncultured Caudovirales phage]